MRTIYLRRCYQSPIILSILLGSFLIFTTMFHITQESIISFIYSAPSICFETENNSFIQPSSSSIPPHYLLIPYGEFATRTSISCQVQKLDEPKKQLSKLHPKYSRYLRGAFPYVVPYANITFNDVENFYTNILISNNNRTEIKQTTFASNIRFEYIPYQFQNGMWHPIGVTSAQRTAILVPLQGRDYNAKAFLFNMHAFVRRQLLTYTIILIEQVHPLGHRFNKGRLFNAGIRYIKKQKELNITCLILHDVDLIPENDGNFYACESTHIKHTTSRVRQITGTRGYNRFYEFLIGGVLILNIDMYKTLNGFSNLYWGWGGEDDDLALRLIQQRMCVVRPSYDIAIYVALPHPRGQRNNARFGLLTWSTVRLASDGYKQIDPLTHIVYIRKTTTVTHLKIDVDADRKLYKPPSIEKAQSSSNKISNRMTTTSKTVTLEKL